MSPELMQPVDEYLAEILAAIVPLAPRELSLADAYGAVAAQDVTARWPLPPFDNSAMDGYAVRAAEVTGAPLTLPVDGEIAAGDTSGRALAPGTCIRIMTGAPLPAGADAVVQFELTDSGTAQVLIREPVEAGTHVRARGGDAVPGDLLLARGTRIGAVALGLLAAAGLGTVLARPRPRVTVISTGDELVEPGQPLAPGQIWESNSVMLAAAARQAGCPVTRYPVVRDRTEAVLAAVQDAMASADVLVTSGGVSMGGEHDVVKAALSKLGTIGFRKVAMQPGMPQGFGLVGDGVPIFTLPGNPVSSYVSFQLFVAPALDKFQDLEPKRMARRQAVLTGPARSPADKRSFLRGILDQQAGGVAQVTPVSGQMSNQLASLARANALIIVPESLTSLAQGTEVDVLMLP
jgi:molybdopterin molybdotransferase